MTAIKTVDKSARLTYLVRLTRNLCPTKKYGANEVTPIATADRATPSKPKRKTETGISIQLNPVQKSIR